MSFKVDPHSATWLCIKSHVEGRIEEIRRRLETNVGFEETQQLRSRLLELKGVMGLVTVDVPLVESDFELPG